MPAHLGEYRRKLESLAKRHGLDYFPVDFEVVPGSFMMEVAVYGLPIRMPHWSFGVRYIYQLVQHRMGHSRLFEVVFPGDPGRAYLANNNSLEENTLVTAHVLGHADFSKNNHLFRRSQEQVGYHIVEQAAAHARRITDAIDEHGARDVEVALDAALALEQYIDTDKPLDRPLYPEHAPHEEAPPADAFRRRFQQLSDADAPRTGGAERRGRLPVPPYPEYDLLWFIAHYGPDLDDWERDLLLTVRAESFYFYPVFACQIMNEGWASYWHARLLREADFLPHQVYLDAIKAHSDVVRPYGGDEEVALRINPYHLGFSIWEDLIENHDLDVARRVMMEDDDFSFLRNYLSEDLAERLHLFTYEAESDGEIRVLNRDIDAVRETILKPKFNFGAPTIAVREMQTDGTLVLEHQHQVDGRGLDLGRARKVLEYVHRLWRRPVVLYTVDQQEDECVLVEPANG